MLRCPYVVHDRAGTAYWTGLPALIIIPAALLVPRLATPERRLKVLFGLTLMGMLGTAILASQSLEWLVVAMVLHGISRGCLFPVTMLTLMEVKGLGTEKMGMASGLLFTASDAGADTGSAVD